MWGVWWPGSKQQGYTVDAVNLLDGALPPETDLVIVAGPQHDLLPQELVVLGRHLEAGGGILLLLDPGALPSVDALPGAARYHARQRRHRRL